jgi:hypothetical protein
MEQQYNIEQVLLDSDSRHSMPLATFLLNPSSGDDMARQRKSLYDTAVGLAARITDVAYTSEILQAELRTAVSFFSSDEQLPAAKLHEKLGLINRLLAQCWA